MTENGQGQRQLTDADIEAILTAAEKRFYLNLGRGIWSIVWKVALAILIAIAAYGQMKGQ